MASSPVPGPPGAVGVMKSKEPLPLVTEELTAVWFSKVLGQQVKEVTVVEAMHGTASKILVKLGLENVDANGSSEAPTEVCVKGGFSPELLKLHPSLFAVYRLEAEFYYYLAPALDMRLPKSWYNGTDVVSGQGIVLLEDLKAKGYSFGDPLEAWSVDRVRSGVSELATLHAKTWGAKPEDFPWFNPEISLRDVISSMLCQSEWDKRFLGDARPPVPDYLADRERIIAAYKTLWTTTDSKLYCIVHGDTHIGNTFITPAGEPGFLDWQGMHSGSALHDIAYFIAGSLTIEDRRKHEDELFQHYLDCLHKAGAPKFERADVWEEYRKHHLHGFAWALTGPMMQTKERVDIMSERHCAAIVDHKSLELLESLPGHGK